MNLDKNYWSKRYTDGDAIWDLSTVSPPLKAYIDQLSDKTLDILIPGCGNAHEAEYLLENGFTSVTLIDLSPIPVETLRKKFGNRPGLTILEGDFFEHQGQYDLILEQTFFCALDPSLRPAYVSKMHSLLKPGGKLAGLLFNCDFEKQGPPFGGHAEEYLPLFSKYFEIKTMETAHNSAEPRANTELFFILKK